MTAADLRIAAIIPTRNRAELAMNAVRSLLDQDCEIEIFLSDNSSDGEELRDFCLREPRVTYLRPERELAMPEHWDWAVGEAMRLSEATHFTVHYDRKFSKPGSWGRLARVVRSWPDLVVSFSSDVVLEQPSPLRLWQTPWTGKAFTVETARVARLLAAGRVADISHALPILSNCLVPRAVLQSIIDRFGDVCNSTAPDTAFMWRFFALNDRYVHHDRPQGIFYGSHRSTGMGYLRGKGGDFGDFRKTFGDRPWLDAAPVPGINLGQNMLYHEHELVRRATGDRLPELDRAAVLDDLGSFLRWIDDPKLKAKLGRILRDHGWTGRDPDPLPMRSLKSVVWVKYARFRMRWLGEVPAHICGFPFRNDAEALKFAMRYPRQAEDDLTHLALLEPTEVPQ